jgi:predicted DsbA family dithiol-disulfide isomerase
MGVSRKFVGAVTGAFVAAVLGVHLAGAASADPAPAAMPTDRAGLDVYIHDYIMRNPQVLRDALLKLDAEAQTENAKRVLSALKSEIYGAGSPEIGNPNAKVTVVEFYDYNCPYCRATYPKIKAYLEANPDTKLVLKDIASLGKESEGVSRVMIAAQKQGKFEPLHDALMTAKGQMTEARALTIAEKLGFDVEQLKKAAHTSETGEALTHAQELADKLNVTMTPLYIVGYNGISGAPDDLIAQLTQHADEIRKSGCDVC